ADRVGGALSEEVAFDSLGWKIGVAFDEFRLRALGEHGAVPHCFHRMPLQSADGLPGIISRPPGLPRARAANLHSCCLLRESRPAIRATPRNGLDSYRVRSYYACLPRVFCAGMGSGRPGSLPAGGAIVR